MNCTVRSLLMRGGAAGQLGPAAWGRVRAALPALQVQICTYLHICVRSFHMGLIESGSLSRIFRFAFGDSDPAQRYRKVYSILVSPDSKVFSGRYRYRIGTCPYLTIR